MLIQSSVPNSISTALSFASDHGKQQCMDLLCGWSHCGETKQNSPHCDECPLDSYKKAIASGEEESKLSSSSIVENSTASLLSAVDDMFASSAPKRDGFVYKRRKLQRNTVALVSEEHAAESMKERISCQPSISSEDNSLTVQRDDLGRNLIISVGSPDALDNRNPSISGQNRQGSPSNALSLQMDKARNLVSVPVSVTDDRCCVNESEVPTDSSIRCIKKSAAEHSFGINGSCSSSKSNTGRGLQFLKNEVDTSSCSSSDDVIAQPLWEFTSARELCISVLESHGLLGGVRDSKACASLEVLGDNYAKPSQICKVCGYMENPLKMLICDLCEEPFHVSCCNPKVKKLPADEWYCQPCSSKIPKPLLDTKTGNAFDIMPEHRKRISYGGRNPISFMLRDNQPYTSGVRIGKDFQAEVPEWSGPISDDYDYFGELPELDPAECAGLIGGNCNKPSKSTSIGNWIRCQEVIYSGNNDEGTKCGKWRRAPLFVVQSDDWDCSCAVLWDPNHADCAVPQELETDIVLKHLKYIEMLRQRLANSKQKYQSDRK